MNLASRALLRFLDLPAGCNELRDQRGHLFGHSDKIPDREVRM